ncbi:MAG: hypothetical protein M5U34_19210 [Chloroflexi bacterium]|nr:hypothetical protein [Chloroflexota bacterium]
MKKIYFIALILSLFLSACNTSLSASDHEIMLAPTATIPPGKDARDIYINQENLNTIKILRQITQMAHSLVCLQLTMSSL